MITVSIDVVTGAVTFLFYIGNIEIKSFKVFLEDPRTHVVRVKIPNLTIFTFVQIVIV